jgi:hypothetical protein
MLKKIKNIALAFVLPLAMAAPLALATPTVSAADIGECNSGIGGSLNQGINAASSGGTDCKLQDASNSPGGLEEIATKVVNFLSVIVGIVAVIMIIVGGFRYITSGGESSNVSGAKNTLIYAIIGLIIVALAQFIVKFVLDNVTS